MIILFLKQVYLWEAILRVGIKKHPYKDMVKSVKEVIEYPLIGNAIQKFSIMEKRIPLKYKIKVFLIKMKWFKVYSFLLK